MTLTLPPKSLSPNARVHWARKHRAAAGYLLVAYGATPKPRSRPTWNAAEVRIVWYSRTRTHPDADNALASLKSGLDGIADALGVDDAGFRYAPLEFAVDRENPRVEIVVRPLADQAAA